MYWQRGKNLPSKETCTLFLARCERDEERVGLVDKGSTLEGGLLPEMRFMLKAGNGS
jgi:hypothetical protein